MAVMIVLKKSQIRAVRSPCTHTHRRILVMCTRPILARAADSRGLLLAHTA